MTLRSDRIVISYIKDELSKTSKVDKAFEQNLHSKLNLLGRLKLDFPSFSSSLDFLRPQNYEEVKKYLDGFNSGATETAVPVLNR